MFLVSEGFFMSPLFCTPSVRMSERFCTAPAQWCCRSPAFIEWGCPPPPPPQRNISAVSIHQANSRLLQWGERRLVCRLTLSHCRHSWCGRAGFLLIWPKNGIAINYSHYFMHFWRRISLYFMPSMQAHKHLSSHEHIHINNVNKTGANLAKMTWNKVFSTTQSERINT